MEDHVMADIIFKAEKIVKTYKKKQCFTALNGLDMEIHRGDIYGLVGENGAGKTTLMRILAGWTRQTSGTITLFRESAEKEHIRQSLTDAGLTDADAQCKSKKLSLGMKQRLGIAMA